MGILAVGYKAVTTAGIPERLSELDLPIARTLDIIALPGNTGSIHVGGRNVSAVSGSETGWRLDVSNNVGDIATLENQQIREVWIDATVSGEGVHWGAVE